MTLLFKILLILAVAFGVLSIGGLPAIIISAILAGGLMMVSGVSNSTK